MEIVSSTPQFNSQTKWEMSGEVQPNHVDNFLKKKKKSKKKKLTNQQTDVDKM